MKVFLENLKPNMSPYNGKGKFVQRLAESFIRNGVKVVSDPKLCDINLCFNKLPSHNKGKKVVRLDNVTYCKEAMQVKTNANQRIANAIANADGVVYQSSLSKSVCEKILGVKARSDKVIPNGVNPSIFSGKNIPLKGRVNFLIACQHLHPLRRVNKVLEIWSQFAESRDDVYLYLNYDNNMTDLKCNNIKNVIVGPVLTQSKLNNYIHSCDALIMTTYRDSCPNLAIESLACGTGLIINSNNGLCEFINETHAIVLDIDGPSEIKQEDWVEPPFNNGEFLEKAFEDIYNGKKFMFNFPESLHIDSVSKIYLNFFKELLQ